MAGIYVHVPFCQKKCLYCDFYSVANNREVVRYVKALKIEAQKRAYELGGMDIETIYFGGGTPSLLPHHYIGEIVGVLRSHYNVSPSAEISFECNPGDVGKVDIEHLLSYGVNRFSIGAQSFHDRLLQKLGRRHSHQEIIALFESLRQEGVNNISLDLIYSIPTEELKELGEDLDQLVSLSPEHISTYDLIYEEGTPLYEMRSKGEINELSEEVSIEMAHTVRQVLTEAGYQHYEISNFSKPSFRSRHNSNYWSGVPYIGLGPSAHSYVAPWRSWNASSLPLYTDQLLTGAGFLSREIEYITPEMEYEEYLLTRLRTAEGISIAEMEEKNFAIPEKSLFRLVNEELLKQWGDRFALTDKGWDFADRVLLELAMNG